MLGSYTQTTWALGTRVSSITRLLSVFYKLVITHSVKAEFLPCPGSSKWEDGKGTSVSYSPWLGAGTPYFCSHSAGENSLHDCIWLQKGRNAQPLAVQPYSQPLRRQGRADSIGSLAVWTGPQRSAFCKPLKRFWYKWSNYSMKSMSFELSEIWV